MKRNRATLSEIKKQIDQYLELNGDAEVSSISTCCGGSDLFIFNLCDLSSDSYKSIGSIKIKPIKI